MLAKSKIRHLATAAHYLADCRLGGHKQSLVESSGADWPSSLEDAYSQQALLHEIMWERGHTVIGSKIGCTTAVMQQYLDMPHPCSGGLYDSRLWRQQGVEPVTVPAGHPLRLGFECEIAVVLGAAIEPGENDLGTLARAIGSVHAAVELVDDRYEDFASRRPGPPAWVADDFFSCGSILGPALQVDPRQLKALHGAMWVDGVCVGHGAGADIIAGDPLEALRWLAGSEAAVAMGGLPKGWVVSLGSVCKTHWLDARAQGDAAGGASSRSIVDVRVAFAEEQDARAPQSESAEQGMLTARLDFGLAS